MSTEDRPDDDDDSIEANDDEPVEETPEAADEAPPEGGGDEAGGATMAQRRATTQRRSGRQRARQNGWKRMAIRYGPFVAVAVVVAAVVVIFGGGDDDGDDDVTTGDLELTTDADELMDRGPMTWERADAEGADVDWGPNCDTERGKIKLPTVYAPPCVEPFEGDNGGATTMGVTADEILVVQYHTDPELDPLGASIIAGGGADTDPDTNQEALENYVDVYNQVYETYGRRVRLEKFVGTGASDDREAARADAREIAAMEPFAVVGGPAQAFDVFAREIVANGVMCLGLCGLAHPEEVVEDPEHQPYIWPVGPTPDQAALAAVEMVTKLAGPGKAELAGSEEMRSRDRVYGIVHFDTVDNVHEGVFETLRDGLEDGGVPVETDVRFELNLERAQENARTIISRLKNDGVTTVIFYGDPFTPSTLTKEATNQDYHPEWILGPSVLGDSTFFGRMNDPQWANGFGLSLLGARGEPPTTEAYALYEWAYGEQAPNNTVVVFEPPLRQLFGAIHMAGSNLTPETFRDGMFRLPPTGGGAINPLVSRGDHDLWPDDSGTDWGLFDNFGLLWWDPAAVGEDELGSEGEGMYRYANMGQRYRLGEFPESIDEAGLFDEASSVVVFEELPEDDQVPDYPPPDLPD